MKTPPKTPPANFALPTCCRECCSDVRDVQRTGIRSEEKPGNELAALKNALNDGLNSDTAAGFDPRQHLRALKTQRRQDKQPAVRRNSRTKG